MIEPRPSNVRITVVNDTSEFLELMDEITPPGLMTRPPDSLPATA